MHARARAYGRAHRCSTRAVCTRARRSLVQPRSAALLRGEHGRPRSQRTCTPRQQTLRQPRAPVQRPPRPCCWPTRAPGSRSSATSCDSRRRGARMHARLQQMPTLTGTPELAAQQAPEWMPTLPRLLAASSRGCSMRVRPCRGAHVGWRCAGRWRCTPHQRTCRPRTCGRPQTGCRSRPPRRGCARCARTRPLWGGSAFRCVSSCAAVCVRARGRIGERIQLTQLCAGGRATDRSCTWRRPARRPAPRTDEAINDVEEQARRGRHVHKRRCQGCYMIVCTSVHAGAHGTHSPSILRSSRAMTSSSRRASASASAPADTRPSAAASAGAR